MANHTVRIEEVARRAGVSSATVSRAFQNRSIKSETRDHILAIAAEMGFRPNQVASALARGRTMTIGVLLPELDNPYFGLMARDFERALRQTRYHLALYSIEEDFCLVKDYLDRLIMERRADGLIISPLGGPAIFDYLDQMTGYGVPLVLLGYSAIPRIPGVCLDYARGGYLAARHLLDLGHRRIAYLAGVRTLNGHAQEWEAASRIEGLRQACAERGAPCDARLIRYCALDLGAAHQAATELLTADPRPTALLALNDNLALTAMDAARMLGIRVPEELSVVGFDDVSPAEYARLTTVHNDTATWVRLSLEQLFGLLDEGGRPGLFNAVIEPHLVVRQSTGPAPKQ